MALADFFDKVNLGAAQRLHDHDRSAFEAKLLRQCVGIAFADNAAESAEGRATLDLLTRLLARLYPTILFQPGGHAAVSLADQLRRVAKAINPLISCEGDDMVTAWIVVGEYSESLSGMPAFFIGSQNWTAHYSVKQQQPCGDTENPFGGAAAACLAAANLFRLFFHVELQGALMDQEVRFSTFSQTINGEFGNEPALPEHLNFEFTLLGTGAIGNGVLWSLLNLPQVQGRIVLVDNQTVSLSNLQRYVLMTREHIGKVKVDVLQEMAKRHPQLEVIPLAAEWQDVIAGLPQSDLRVVATALDKKEERFYVQSALPHSIFNAWTGPDGLGVSRHQQFDAGPCLACLYLPNYEEKKDTQKVADALNIPGEEPFVNEYMSEHKFIDDAFIQKVHAVGGIAIDRLVPFLGQKVENLYSEGVCGGRVIEVVVGDTPQDMEVPLAHESALAGILLAVELLTDAHELRTAAIDPITRIDLSRPLHRYLQEEMNKHYTGRCICQDDLFSIRYHEKWQAPQ